MKNKKILAIIPARGGSKGLPKKNITILNGKPLLAWTIEASLKSTFITKTVVSSENKKILKIAKIYESDTIKRPKKLAQDTSTSESVIEHALKVLKMENEEFDYVILLQPTSPLRDEKDIDNSFKKLFKRKATALISINKIDNKILKAFKKTKSNYLEGISNNNYPFQRRQDLPKTYMSNGAIYIINVRDFLKNKSFFTTKTIAYCMSNLKSIDIDTKKDLVKIKQIIGINNDKPYKI